MILRRSRPKSVANETLYEHSSARLIAGCASSLKTLSCDVVVDRGRRHLSYLINSYMHQSWGIRGGRDPRFWDVESWGLYKILLYPIIMYRNMR